jgi:predicted ATPase
MTSDPGATFADRSVICPVLVGREGALDSTRAVLARVRGGAGSILLIAGEAGIGKTRLLREMASEARNQGFVVLKGA